MKKLLFAAAFLTALPAFAEDYTWAPTSDSSVLSDVLTLTSSDSVTFGSSASATTVTISSDTEVGTVTVSADYTFSIDSGITFTTGTLTVDDNSTLTLDGAGTLAATTFGTTGTVSVGEGVTLDLTGTTYDGVSLTNITGSGTVTLNISTSDSSGSTLVVGDSSFKGTTNIANAGYIVLTSATSYGSALTVADGAQFYVQDTSTAISLSGTISGTGTNKIFNNGGTLTFDSDSSVSFSTLYVQGSDGTTTFEGDVDIETLYAYRGAIVIESTGTVDIETLSFTNGNSVENSVTFALPDGSEGVTYYVDTISTLSNGWTAGRDITIESGVTVSTSSFTNSWGIGTVTIDGTLDVSGTFKMASGAKGENIIIGTGTLSVGALDLANVGTYYFGGGLTVKLGSSGITNSTSWTPTIYLGNTTFAAKDDSSWSSSHNFTLGYDASGAEYTGTTFEIGSGATVTLTGTISDYSDSATGSLIKTGEGTLTLTGANTYSGGTTVSEGTLSVSDSGALGTGTVTVEESGTLEFTGTISADDALTVSNSGTVTFSDDIVIDITSSDDDTGSYTVITFSEDSTGTTNWSELSYGNFTLDGAALSARTGVDVSTDGVVTLTLASIVWTGTEDNSDWNSTTDGTWTVNGSGTTFQESDTVIFDGTSTVTATVSADASAGSISLSASVSQTISINEGVTLSTSTLEINSGATLTVSGAGTLDIADSGLTLYGDLVVEEGATVDLGSGSGTLTYSGGTVSGAGALVYESTSSSHSTANLSSFTGDLYWTGNFGAASTLGEGATVHLSSSSDTTSSMWGRTTLSANVVLETDYLFGDSTYSNIIIDGDLSASASDEDNTLSIGTSSTANTGTGVKVTGTTDLVNLTVGIYGAVEFAGETSIDSVTNHASTDLSSITATDATGLLFSGNATVGTLTSNGVTEFSGTATVTTVTLTGASTTTFSGGGAIGDISFTSSGDQLNFSGDEGTSYTVNSISFLSTSAYDRDVTIDEGVTVSAASVTNSWGMGVLTVNGTLAVSGTLKMASGANASTESNLITGTGTLSVGTLDLANVGTYNFAGGIRVEIGSGGITTSTSYSGAVAANLGDTTFASDYSWSTSKDFTLGGELDDDYAGTTFEVGSTDSTAAVTLTGTISDYSDDYVGSLIKTGDGSLTLSGTNTYSGGTTILAGTLIASSSSALGTGAVTISGGTLQASSDVTLSDALTIDGGTLLVDSGVTLTASSIEIVLSDAYLTSTTTSDDSSSTSSAAKSNTILLTSVADDDSGTTTTVYAIDGSGTVSATSIVVTLDEELAEEIAGISTETTYTFSLAASTIAGVDEVTVTLSDGSTLDSTYWTVTLESGTLTLVYSIPEPGSFGLLAGTLALAFAAARRRRSRKA